MDTKADTGQASTPDSESVSGMLSAREAAAILGVHERTIRRAISRGELEAVKHGRSFQIAADALACYWQSLRQPRPAASVALVTPRTRLPSSLRFVDRESVPTAGLPQPATSFIGREREIAAVTALLRQPEVRFVTLVGPGGVGKTRLAVAAASEIADTFASGVRFVPLASIHDTALVASSIIQVLGARERGDEPLFAALTRVLREQQMLLVLDNFEHLLPAAPFVGELLASCQGLSVLTTSRVRLNVAAERVFPVPPLSLPRRLSDQPSSLTRPSRLDHTGPGARPQPLKQTLFGYGAVALFVERTRTAAPEMALTDADAPTVQEICHRLDGLPLAIELAAAQTRLLPPAALLQRLEPRLPLLVGGPRDQPERLRTMRNAMAWSYELLSPADQELFLPSCRLRRWLHFGSGGRRRRSWARAGT